MIVFGTIVLAVVIGQLGCMNSSKSMRENSSGDETLKGLNTRLLVSNKDSIVEDSTRNSPESDKFNTLDRGKPLADHSTKELIHAQGILEINELRGREVDRVRPVIITGDQTQVTSNSVVSHGGSIPNRSSRTHASDGKDSIYKKPSNNSPLPDVSGVSDNTLSGRSPDETSPSVSSEKMDVISDAKPRSQVSRRTEVSDNVDGSISDSTDEPPPADEKYGTSVNSTNDDTDTSTGDNVDSEDDTVDDSIDHDFEGNEDKPLPALARVQRNEMLESNDFSDHKEKRRVNISQSEHFNSSVQRMASMLVGLKSSSQDLWNSLNGPEWIKTIADNWSTRWSDKSAYFALTTVLLLASQLAILPTKTGANAFDIDDSGVQEMCKLMTESKFLTGLGANMEDRLAKRLFRYRDSYPYHEYTVMPESATALDRHPLANVPVVCFMVDNFEWKSAILNHRIGVEISRRVHPEYPIISLEYESMDFSINDALDNLLLIKPEDLLYGIREVTYKDQDGKGEGVYRDWFTKMIEKVFDNDNGFFVLPDNIKEKQIYRINMSNANKEEFIKRFEAIGILFAMSLIDGIPLGIDMNFAIYQILMGKMDEWTPMDLFKDDKIVYEGWKYIKNLDKPLISDYDSKSLDQQRNLIVKTSASTDEIPLTKKNVGEWAKLAIADHLYTKAKSAYTSIANGLYKLLPRNIFDGLLHPDDLRHVLRGDISAKLIIESMTYGGGYTASSPQIQWLHKLLLNASPEIRSNFVHFVTGLRALPFGFGKGGAWNRRINILRVDNSDALPSGSTCCYILDLPEYPDEETFFSKLQYAILSKDMGQP